MMKKIIQFILRILAKLALKKYKPKIVGVTGSVGKSSTKEAIALILSSQFKVRQNLKNYNNEIGVPLTILGLETGGRSVFSWVGNFFKAIFLVLFKRDYPEILILEMGADRPGDIKYLTDFVPCQVGVITSVGPSHLEFFKSIDQIAKEKEALIRSLPEKGTAVLNYDDSLTREMANHTLAKTLTYGFDQEADIQASELNIAQENGKYEQSFKISYQGNVVPVRMPKALGKSHIMAALAGAAVGLAFDFNLVEISNALNNYKPLPGRLNLIKGVKETLIIDDSYNSAPASSLAALEVLEGLRASRKIAVLGDMLELGTRTEQGHREVGKKAASMVDILFVVGERARFIAEQAKKSGLAEKKIFKFSRAEEVGRALQAKLEKGDAVLIKASRAIHLEEVIKEVMAQPEKAEKLLVQD